MKNGWKTGSYLLWAFLVSYCPCWLGSFVGHNYLEHSAGFLFLYGIFFVGFIFCGFYICRCFHPTRIKSIGNLTHEIMCPWKFARLRYIYIPYHERRRRSGWSGCGWTTCQFNGIHHHSMHLNEMVTLCVGGCLSCQTVRFVELCYKWLIYMYVWLFVTCMSMMLVWLTRSTDKV